ncbi:MAG: DUF86 domain-containing protein [Prevotella sp.]|nr:DUF86 domain-containing protein [Prevotella sp.]MBP3750113.1 DUF86 domain-containing protein [Prevotella sp.]
MDAILSERMPIIWHTLDKLELAINRIKERTINIHSVDDFLSTPGGMEKLDATCMVLIAIGETVKNLDKMTEGKILQQYPQIPWKNVMGIRDVMAHHYFEVDADIVFKVITKDLDPLLGAISFFKEYLSSDETSNE